MWPGAGGGCPVTFCMPRRVADSELPELVVPTRGRDLHSTLLRKDSLGSLLNPEPLSSGLSGLEPLSSGLSGPGLLASGGDLGGSCWVCLRELRLQATVCSLAAGRLLPDPALPPACLPTVGGAPQVVVRGPRTQPGKRSLGKPRGPSLHPLPCPRGQRTDSQKTQVTCPGPLRVVLGLGHPSLPRPLGESLPAQRSHLKSKLDCMLAKRLGKRWAMAFQSTSSSRKPCPRSNRHVAHPSRQGRGCPWGTRLTS